MKNRRIERVPIGPKTAERMSNTMPGQLAAMLNAILYCAVEKTDEHGIKRLTLPATICNRWEHLGKSLFVRDKENELNTEAILGECRDILELYGYYEVIE